MKSKKTFKSFADAVKHAKENKRKYIDRFKKKEKKSEDRHPIGTGTVSIKKEKK